MVETSYVLRICVQKLRTYTFFNMKKNISSYQFCYPCYLCTFSYISEHVVVVLRLVWNLSDTSDLNMKSPLNHKQSYNIVVDAQKVGFPHLQILRHITRKYDTFLLKSSQIQMQKSTHYQRSCQSHHLVSSSSQHLSFFTLFFLKAQMKFSLEIFQLWYPPKTFSFPMSM